MIASDTFVFVPMRKTGGQSPGNIVDACLPHARHAGYHHRWHPRPEVSKPLPGIITDDCRTGFCRAANQQGAPGSDKIGITPIAAPATAKSARAIREKR